MYIANDNSDIVRANLDGTGGESLGNLGGFLDDPYGIALDVAAGKMYATDYRNDIVIQANLDGTGAVNLGNLNGTLANAWVIALDLPALPPSGQPSIPRVINVTSTASCSGSYTVGSVIVITVRFSHPVWVKGLPQLVLRIGNAPAMAYYNRGSGKNILTFLYTVADGDDLCDLDYWSPWALESNGGRIYSNQDIDADTDLPVPGEPGSLGYNMAQGVLGKIYPVYRFYNLGLAKHLFTIDENEKNHLVANSGAVWRFEYTAYYAYLAQQYDAASRQQKDTLQAVHRFYSESLQTHLFTIDENEKEHLINNAADVWQYEGPVFYVPADYQEGTCQCTVFTIKTQWCTSSPWMKMIKITSLITPVTPGTLKASLITPFPDPMN